MTWHCRHGLNAWDLSKFSISYRRSCFTQLYSTKPTWTSPLYCPSQGNNILIENSQKGSHTSNQPSQANWLRDLLIKYTKPLQVYQVRIEMQKSTIVLHLDTPVDSRRYIFNYLLKTHGIVKAESETLRFENSTGFMYAAGAYMLL